MTGFEGRITWDTTMPNGQPRRGLDAIEDYLGAWTELERWLRERDG